MAHIMWDFPKGVDILYFDHTKSYELTGYRPINEKQSLDFDPSWFTEVRDRYEENKVYCPYLPKTKAFKQFWEREMERIVYGMEVNGYRITGDNYMFLNYYRMRVKYEDPKSGKKFTREQSPDFHVMQYEFFHYVELCELLGKDCVVGKARGLGFSEIAASLGVNVYTHRNTSVCTYTANIDKYVTKLSTKVWGFMDHLNINTQGGFRRLRSKNSSDIKVAGVLNKKGRRDR